MRTKDEIVTYLKENGHTQEAMSKITGFLIGANLKDVKEKIVFKRGNDTWDDFFEWYENKDARNEEHPLYDIFTYLHKLRNETDNASEVERISNCIAFLVSEFVFDASADDDWHVTYTLKAPCEKRNKNRS